ncbi:MAG: serine/threonine protein kinase [bacterium]|nr:serine/threonine protein kinase [bacterium]
MAIQRTVRLQDDRFEILRELGRGSGTRVVRAFDHLAGGAVALKTPLGSPRGVTRAQLQEEFEAWASLDHSCIPRALELRVARSGPLSRGAAYLVLEYVDGAPCTRAPLDGPSGFGCVERIAIDLLRALEHVHRAGWVHRDVKPANVLVRAVDGRVVATRLIDFGLAVRAGHREPHGTVSGSLPFVSPEALLGRPVDGRSDLYSAGILLYELATGGRPVESSAIEDHLRWHLGGPPADPRIRRPAFPEHLARLIRRLTQRDPAARPATAGHALRGFACGANRARLDRLSRTARLPLDTAVN